MALLLVVATTEATDPTRASDPFRTTANVSSVSVSSSRPQGRAHGVAEEVRAGLDIDRVSPGDPDRQTMEPRVRITWRRRCIHMAAKKKAAKKPAAKKKTAKKK